MNRLLIALLAISVPGFAQAPAAQPKSPVKKSGSSAAPGTRWPIESISVEGNRIYKTEQVVALSGLKVGQVAGRPEFEAARERLVSSGVFETVGYKFVPGAHQGYAATLQVTEVEQVYPVIFEDLHVSTLDLQADLTAKDPLFSPEKLAATQPVLNRYVKWVEEFLAAKGVPEKITASVTPGIPGDYQIVFRPSKPLPSVAQVTFEGNKVVPQNVLREAVSTVAIGAPYTEDSFRQILNAGVRPTYEARGRLRVSFPEIRTEPDKDVKGVKVFVTVNEGESYELGKVTFEGNSPLQSDFLLKTGDFKTGDVANFDRVNDGLERIRKALRHAGYMQGKVTMARTINDEKKVADLTVRIDAGTQYTMAKLILVGLDLDGEAEMRRIWNVKEGKPFNPDYPELFLKRIREEGMFDNLGETKSDFKLNEKDHTADVTLTFKGLDPQNRPGRRGRGPGRGGLLWSTTGL
ncbi:MAG TPA: POTRA domain-containing protein [Bryobacteraceae bacterium]|nr:POTRA domain-containing protein [Bryobacteraceae bacterium]